MPKKPKKRKSDKGKRFSLSNVADYRRVLHDTGVVKSTKGDYGTSRAYTCSSLVLEATYPRTKTNRLGSRKKRHFVTWHVFNKQVHNTKATSKSLRDADPKASKEIAHALDEGRDLNFGNSNDSGRPEDIIAGMISHLQNKMPGAKISATLIPGTATFSPFKWSARDAYETVHEILKRQKKAGAIRNIHLRGAGGGHPRGASHVWIKQGRIYRDEVN